MKTTLVVIDPQNDFCDIPKDMLPINPLTLKNEEPALAIKGSHENMKNVANHILNNVDKIDSIVVTLDSHANVAIERTSAWLDRHGRHVKPFTTIKLEDVLKGDFQPKFEKELVIRQLKKIDKDKSLMIWPDHCVIGTWGHNVHYLVADAFKQWEKVTGKAVHYVNKGEYQWSEHFGAFIADMPIVNVPSTLFNVELLEKLLTANKLQFTGLASSHCVQASVRQYFKYLETVNYKQNETIEILKNCMSPVVGFENVEEEFFKEMESKGVMVC